MAGLVAYRAVIGPGLGHACVRSPGSDTLAELVRRFFLEDRFHGGEAMGERAVDGEQEGYTRCPWDREA
jgi:hypothetical protein